MGGYNVALGFVNLGYIALDMPRLDRAMKASDRGMGLRAPDSRVHTDKYKVTSRAVFDCATLTEQY